MPLPSVGSLGTQLPLSCQAPGTFPVPGIAVSKQVGYPPCGMDILTGVGVRQTDTKEMNHPRSMKPS